VTILDDCISLNSVQIFLVVFGVVDMCHLLLIMSPSEFRVQTYQNYEQS
jgi:hypothetical protein